MNKIDQFTEIKLYQNLEQFFKIDCPVLYDDEDNKSVQLPIFLQIYSELKIDNILIYGSFTNKLPGEDSESQLYDYQKNS